jgi:general secretion pathway protein K
MGARSRQEGVILLVVLFFALLLTAGVATFLRRATVDSMISRNREQAAQADALARGGVRLAEALLLEDLLGDTQQGSLPMDSGLDPWALKGASIPTDDAGDELKLTIEDTGGRLNLNALFEPDDTGHFVARNETEEYLTEVLERVIEGLPIDPGRRALYDPRELAENLMDWVDGDEDAQRGGPENDYYERQDPPYRAPNRPFRSVDELRQVEGFDALLADTLARYVSVYPFAPGGCGDASVGCGINVNTAPPYVLYLLYTDDGTGERRLADEDLVRQILRVREEGLALCPGGVNDDACQPMNEIVPNANLIFPPPTFTSEVFVVTAEARVGADVRRVVEAVVDRSQAPEMRLLSWRER